MGKPTKISNKRLKFNDPNNCKLIMPTLKLNDRNLKEMARADYKKVTSFLADESNDSGLGDLSTSSLCSSNFSIFQDEDANDTTINSIFADASPHLNNRTVFSLKSLNDDDLSTICNEAVNTSPLRKNTFMGRDSDEPACKRKKEVNMPGQCLKRKNFNLSEVSKPHFHGDESQENIPMKTSCTNGLIARNCNSPSDVSSMSKRKNKHSILCGNFSNVSKSGAVRLEIVNQPERQHRARYLTEGSRGAVKDQSGKSFPEVKLSGYYKKCTLQVFVGNDSGKVQPHLYYQASKVCGKHSTPCIETKIDGTVVLEMQLKPEGSFSCDCVGILKERNVDVEKRLAICSGFTNKKKSTKCRLIFRATIDCPRNPNGVEILQVTSAPISCTQLPGVPEICKKSLKECSVNGQNELFIIGKNFLKDTEVVFEGFRENGDDWRVSVVPDKDYFQHNHLVCEVPRYQNQAITSPVSVSLMVVSGGKISEPHIFTYKPLQQGVSAENAGALELAQSVPTSPSSSAVTHHLMDQAILHIPHLTNDVPMTTAVPPTSLDHTSNSCTTSTNIPVQNKVSTADVHSFTNPISPLNEATVIAPQCDASATQLSPPVASSASQNNMLFDVKQEVQSSATASPPILMKPARICLNLVQPSQVVPQAPVVLSKSSVLVKAASINANIASNPPNNIISPNAAAAAPVLKKFVTLPLRTLVQSANVGNKNISLQLSYVKNNVASVANVKKIEPSGNNAVGSNMMNKPTVAYHITNEATGCSQPVIGLPAQGFIDDAFAQIVNKPSVPQKQTAESGQPKQKDFNEHVNLMTEYSELPDADLIKIINPSTFDNV